MCSALVELEDLQVANRHLSNRGDDEANIKNGKISIVLPFRALLKYAGDFAEFRHPVAYASMKYLMSSTFKRL